VSRLERFAPTLAEAHARIAAVRPDDYARSRNALDGAVSGLSPYITHGFVDLPQVAAGVAAGHRLDPQHRFMFELGWREFFRHVWQQRGEAIFASMHVGPLPDDAYARELPADLREARTGVPVIDRAVRTLYATGYLHNHARMWLASYVVHLRRVHWRAGADWLYAHLLDGDLASNHLSWQWVAGTFSRKPYLFNSDNVARYSPSSWHSPGSVIDTSYESLDEMARGGVLPPVRPGGEGVGEPQTHRMPTAEMHVVAASGAEVMGRDVWLVHPWALGDPPNDLPTDGLRVSICTREFHDRWAWSDARWAFVGARMGELSTLCWHDSVAAIRIALQGARSVRSVDDEHLDATLRSVVTMDAARPLFHKVEKPCATFSQWWKQTSVMDRNDHAAATATFS
jgi:deoxyribodipyrimidine photo-lyase